MRITLLLILGLFLQTSIFAQTDNQSREKGTEDTQQELPNQLKDLGSLFGGGEIKIDSLLQNLDLGNLNLENLNMGDLNIEELLGGNGGLDMQSLMQLMDGMDLEQLLGPLMGDLDKMMPKQQQPQQEEEILRGEDGKPLVKKKKKKSTKKTYKL